MSQQEKQQALHLRQQLSDVQKTIAGEKQGDLGQQAVGVLSTLQDADVLHKATVGASPSTKQLAADTEQLLDTVKKTVVQKDVIGLAQQLAQETQEISQELAAQGAHAAKGVAAKGTEAAEATQYTAHQVTLKLMHLVGLVVSSNEFRDIIQTAFDISFKAIVQVAPVDPAKAHKEKEKIMQGKTGEVEQDVKKEAKQAKQDAKDKVVGKTASETQAKIEDMVQPAVSRAAEAIAPHVTNIEKGRETVSGAATQLFDSAAKEVSDRLDQLDLSDEDVQRLYDRTIGFLRRVQKKPDFQHTLTDLVEVVRRYFAHLGKKAKEVKDVAPSALDKRVTTAQEHARQLLENFCNHRSLQPVLDAMDALWAALGEDKETLHHLQGITTWVLKCLREPSFTAEGNLTKRRKEFNRNVTWLRTHLYAKYAPRLDAVVSETNTFFQGFVEDELNQQLRTQTYRLAQDLFLDANGNPTLKPGAINDLVSLVLGVVQQIRYIPVARIEHFADDADFVLDDVAFFGPDLKPSQITINSATNIDMEKVEAGKEGARTAITVELKGIRGEAQDCVFLYRRKTIPAFTDSGLMDIKVYGESGLSIYMLLSNLSSGGSTVFELERVRVDVESLDLSFKEVEHSTLYTVFSPYIHARARDMICSYLEDKIKELAQGVREQVLTLAGGDDTKRKPMP